MSVVGLLAAKDENPYGQKMAKVFGGLEIDEAGHVVKVRGKSINLSPKEFELLLYLAANKGIALSRDQILNAIWEYDYFGEARTVDTHIRRLRAKLGNKEEYIFTIRGIGYKFEVKK